MIKITVWSASAIILYQCILLLPIKWTEPQLCIYKLCAIRHVFLHIFPLKTLSSHIMTISEQSNWISFELKDTKGQIKYHLFKIWLCLSDDWIHNSEALSGKVEQRKYFSFCQNNERRALLGVKLGLKVHRASALKVNYVLIFTFDNLVSKECGLLVNRY